MRPPSQAEGADDAKSRLEAMMRSKMRRYQTAQRAWSAVYHGSIFIAPAASLTTTVLTALKITAISTTILSALVTFAVAISSAGRFRQKWVNARTSRSKVERLLVALDDPNANAQVIRTDFLKVIEGQDNEVIQDGERPT